MAIKHPQTRKHAASYTKKQQGFTIIELLIATTVFSLVLLMAVSGILHVTRLYYKGVVQARTQETTRTIAEEIGEAARFNPSDLSNLGSLVSAVDIPAGDPDTGFFCIGPRRYTIAIDRQLTTNSPSTVRLQKRHVMWADQPGPPGCTAPADLDLETPTADGREMLAEFMRITHFRITPLANAGPGVYKIDIGVAYGDSDLLESDSGAPKTCKIGTSGQEFCAVTSLSVVTERRLN